MALPFNLKPHHPYATKLYFFFILNPPSNLSPLLQCHLVLFLLYYLLTICLQLHLWLFPTSSCKILPLLSPYTLQTSLLTIHLPPYNLSSHPALIHLLVWFQQVSPFIYYPNSHFLNFHEIWILFSICDNQIKSTYTILRHFLPLNIPYPLQVNTQHPLLVSQLLLIQSGKLQWRMSKYIT